MYTIPEKMKKFQSIISPEIQRKKKIFRKKLLETMKKDYAV